MTVNKAYSLLKQEGYIFADCRSGARVRKEFAVTKELSEKSKELLQQIISEAKVSGMTKEEFLKSAGSQMNKIRSDLMNNCETPENLN